MLGKIVRNVVLVLVFSFMVVGLVRAVMSKFNDRRQAVLTEAQSERERLGLSDRAILAQKYPSPEITLMSAICLQPGATAELVIKGHFVPGTTFLLGSDEIEVVTESVSATEYRATIKAPAHMGPADVGLDIYSPVSACHLVTDTAIIVSGNFEWNLKSENGWRIKAKLKKDYRCADSSDSDEMLYDMEFYRGSEVTPFEKRSAKLQYSAYSSNPYQFSIDEEGMSGELEAELQDIVTRMQDSRISSQEMEKLMARMEALQEQQMALYAKLADPEYVKQLEEKKKDFGCRYISLSLQGEQVNGSMSCGERVGGNIKLTGTVKTTV